MMLAQDFVMEYIEGTPLKGLCNEASYQAAAFWLGEVKRRGGQADKRSHAHHGADQQDQTVATLYYMSPEQLRSQAAGQEIDGRSDIFSFGLMLYEMLTGK